MFHDIDKITQMKETTLGKKFRSIRIVCHIPFEMEKKTKTLARTSSIEQPRLTNLFERDID